MEARHRRPGRGGGAGGVAGEEGGGRAASGLRIPRQMIRRECCWGRRGGGKDGRGGRQSAGKCGDVEVGIDALNKRGSCV